MEDATYATKLPGGPMVFVVGGFDKNDPYGRVFSFEVPHAPIPVEQNPHPGLLAFGITWGGQIDVVNRLLTGFDTRVLKIAQDYFQVADDKVKEFHEMLKEEIKMSIPYDTLALQDCINLAIFVIRTTISAQQLSVGVRGCGGPIDVAAITRQEGFRMIQEKQVFGEFQPTNVGFDRRYTQ
jgi:hypothetical protein